MSLIHQDTNEYRDDAKYSFDNRIVIRAYAQRVLDLLGGPEQCRELRVLELGLGHGFTAEMFSKSFGTYHIVDGSSEIIEEFWQTHDRDSFNAEFFVSYFENFETRQRYDAIIMGFVLEHVEDPLVVLKRFRAFLKEDGRMFITVPNALAMHRRLGHYAGLLDDMYVLSENDLAFGHRRYFDPDKLNALIEEAAYKTVRMEGIFLKPITTAQLQSLELSEEILQSMVKLGIDYPDLSNALLAEIKLR